MSRAAKILDQYRILIASNRGPVTFHRNDNGEYEVQRGSGGLVTALTGIAGKVDATWISCSITEDDTAWSEGKVPLTDDSPPVGIKFITPSDQEYHGYYNVIANPLIWFLQHSMWDVPRSPLIDKDTWHAWDTGYTVVNKKFAQEIAEQIQHRSGPALVMLQDYHLYLIARQLREILESLTAGVKNVPILHFIHIPWPGPEYWGILPPVFRQSILDSLCAVDLLGLQTREDALNFLRTCESYLPQASVKYSRGRIWYRNHATHVRDFPITIDTGNLKAMADSPELETHRSELLDIIKKCKLILRIDRIDPSKNIIRGFKAYEEMLEIHPEYREQVIFLAMLVPSRLEVDEYQNYLDELMASAGRVNATYGNSQWEPIRILVGDNYSRAVAAMQVYDVLLVNAIADGMNLVAKEGPLVNRKNGVLILSEKTGARQQLESGATVISPCDIFATSEALHQALSMPEEQRAERSSRLKWLLEQEDIYTWLDDQIEALAKLNRLGESIDV